MSEQNLNALKTLVISMGVVLVLGFVVVGAAAWMKMKGAPAISATSKVGLPADCPGGDLNLAGRGKIIDTSVDGQLMRVALAGRDGSIQVVHIDVCSGKELSALRITTDPDLSMIPKGPIPFPADENIEK